ncbi:AAA family ATPase [Methylocystis sp. FS]|uniref:AAA family ATPase n=1 Tax=Methylocystis silviterrae TaxID=2743612 RepID=UPI001583DB36|nr:AAA family ATPase [Methylocystis silviterrae]NUJ80293.1 AAA family ATPase [Methylocystis silviterrae]
MNEHASPHGSIVSRFRRHELNGSGQRDNALIIAPSPFVWRDPSTIPTRQWLYGRRLIRKFVSATVAPGGVGKSTLGDAEAVAMTTGRPLLGVAIDAALRVWVWNGEDPREELERRIAATCIFYGVKPEDIGDRLYLDSGREQPIVIAQIERAGFTIAVPTVDAVIAAIRERRIDVMRIDPFVSSHRVTENDNNAIDAVVKQWAKIADVTGCAIDLVHHVRKNGGAEVTAEDARGASALHGAVRHMRVLNVMTKDEAAAAGVENRKLYFRADDGKANLAPASDSSEWFNLVSVSLGNGGGGPDDHVGVATKWKWPDPLDQVSVHDLRAVQTEVANGRWRANVQAADWVGKAVAKAMKMDASDKRHRAKIIGLLKVWKSTGTLVEVDGKDEARRTKTYVEVGTPAND